MEEAIKQKIEGEIGKMDRKSACESSIHLVVAAICHDGQHLANGQKADIMSAALGMHRCIILAEALKILTTAKSECDLLLPGDDEEKAKILRSVVTAALLKSESRAEEATNRFFTLTEMLFHGDAKDAPPEASVKPTEGMTSDAVLSD